MKKLLSLRNVTKRFGGKVALSGATLTLGKGEILGILGPSGAGKTTMLRIMGLLEPPTKGRVLFRGEAVSPEGDGALEVRRRMAMILQKPIVFKGTVVQNAMYGLRVRGVAPEQAMERAERALGKVGLEDVLDRHASTLSGGEVQRLAFARAAVTEPDVLLLDEFTANLDPANITILEKQVCDFRDGGGAVAMITHSVQQGRRLADRICLLLDGKIVEIERTEKFFESPATEEARDFVSGKMVW
jgi:tungstate transport system ATP-binding protein